MLDTPTRAAQCGRPRTRGWSDLLEAAKSDEEEAVRLRSELNRYLEEADNFSKRRASRKEARAALLKEASAAATSPRRKIKSLSPQTSPMPPPSQAGSSSRPTRNISKTPPPPSLPSSTPVKTKPPLPPSASSTPLKENQSLSSPAPKSPEEQVPPATPPPKIAAKSATTSAHEAAPATPPLKSAPKSTEDTVAATSPPKSAGISAQETVPVTPPSKTAASASSTSPSSSKKRKVQDDGVEFEDLSNKSLPDLCEILATLSSPWSTRVSALRALSAKKSSELKIDTRLVKALCVQLADLRSKVVVESAHTIETHASNLSVDDALFIVDKGLGCVSVKKAVMADARETAVIKALAPLYKQDAAWAAVLSHVENQPTERARAVAVKATCAWLGKMSAKKDEKLAGLLNVCLVDKSGKVRDEGKALFKAANKKLSKERMEALKKKLSSEAAAKLPVLKKKKKAGGRPKLNMKEEIRAKRMAMKKKEAAGGTEGEDFRMAASEASSKDAAPITTRDMNRKTVPASPEPAKKKKKLNSAKPSPTVLANKENSSRGDM